MPERGLIPEVADSIREVWLGAYMESRRRITAKRCLQEPPWYGTVCPVVWEDGGGDPASYPIAGYLVVPAADGQVTTDWLAGRNKFPWVLFFGRVKIFVGIQWVGGYHLVSCVSA